MEMKQALRGVDGDVNNLLCCVLSGLPQLLAYVTGEEARNVMAVQIKPLGVRLNICDVSVARTRRCCCIVPLFFSFLDRPPNLALSLIACCYLSLPSLRVMPYVVLRPSALGQSE